MSERTGRRKEHFGVNVKETWDFPGRPGVKNSPPSAGGEGSIPGRGAKIPYASRPKNQHIKQKQYCNKFNKDFKKMVHIKKKNLKKKSQGDLEITGVSMRKF